MDGEVLVNMLSDDHSSADAKGRHCMLLEPYGYRWFRVGRLDYLLKREEM
jgi:maltose alpha-D-glucosyltransferase/alpha-amylase